MIDIVDFWRKQIELWQTNNKCGFCWEFHAPMSNQKANWQQFNDPCCVQPLLTNFRMSDKPEFTEFGIRTGDTKCRYIFTIKFLMNAELGTNMDTEIPEHPTEESLWSTIYYPLLECIGCEPFLDFCEIHGRIRPQIIQWDKSIETNYTDENLYGWKVNVIFDI